MPTIIAQVHETALPIPLFHRRQCSTTWHRYRQRRCHHPQHLGLFRSPPPPPTLASLLHELGLFINPLAGAETESDGGGGQLASTNAATGVHRALVTCAGYKRGSTVPPRPKQVPQTTESQRRSPSPPKTYKGRQ